MLLGLKNVSLRLGSTYLLDSVNMTLERGERLCLVGRNGTGKSTLLKILTGELRPDSGEVMRAQGVRMAKLVQEVPPATEGTVYDVVAQGLGDVGRLVAQYHHLLEHDPHDLNLLGKLQTALEAQNGWALESRVQTAISRLELPTDALFASLSGGLKRRVLLAQAVVSEPDALLLDEPTNHLDIASIAWLEEFLLGFRGALLFITHDRAFLRRLATRICDLDRGTLSSWPGSYDDYLLHKDEALHAESQQNALFDKRLAQEEVWIRRGIEARRTRDQGRVKRLLEMREVFQQRRKLQGQVKMVVQEAERSGKLVAEAVGVSHGYGGQPIIRNFSTVVLRGDKIGIIGPNGVGKTTLLNILLGKLEPDAGTLHHGTKLEIAYFDQLRSPLEDEKSACENIGDGKEFIEINGVRKHVMSYLQDFLFTPDRARSPVKVLSGGERNRLLLARLFAQASNLLVLDEPTNDLDVETLDLLEELLVDYQGTVLLVSHDREFLNNVVTRSLVFEGNGRVGDYVGGYDDWLRQRPQPPAPAPKPVSAVPAKTAPAPSTAPALNSKERRELEVLPSKIEKLEAEQTRLAEQLGSPEFYSGKPETVAAVQQRLKSLEQELAAAYARWEDLELLR